MIRSLGASFGLIAAATALFRLARRPAGSSARLDWLGHEVDVSVLGGLLLALAALARCCGWPGG